MASSSLVLPSISIKTLILSKTGRNPSLSLPSSTLCLSSSLRTKPISVSSTFPSSKGCLSSRFVTRVASEFDQASSGREETNFSPDLKIFVGNLPFSVESADLAGLFKQSGTVEMVELDGTILKTIKTESAQELQKARELILHILIRDLYKFCNEYVILNDDMDHFKQVTAKDLVCSQVVLHIDAGWVILFLL